MTVVNFGYLSTDDGLKGNDNEFVASSGHRFGSIFLQNFMEELLIHLGLSNCKLPIKVDEKSSVFRFQIFIV